jgi:predicted CoA-binding protein
MRTSLAVVEDFLAQKRIAVVGVSHDPEDFSVKLFDEFLRRGYDVVPVTPNAAAVCGRPAFSRMQDVQPPVDAALLMTSPPVTETVVHDSHQAGVRRIWMYRAAGQGAVSPQAVAFCRARGMDLVAGECPFMFLSRSGAIHKLHGWVRKITGRYPDRTA